MLEAFRILKADRPNKKLIKTAWEILESSVSNPIISSNVEIMIALIGSFNQTSSTYQAICFKPRILDNLEIFKNITLKQEYRQRLRDSVLLPLIERMYIDRSGTKLGGAKVDDHRLVRDHWIESDELQYCLDEEKDEWTNAAIAHITLVPNEGGTLCVCVFFFLNLS